MSSKKREAVEAVGSDEVTGKKPRRLGIDDDEAFDSDAELPKESIKNRLSWRTEDSFSDWQIIIKVSLDSGTGKDDDEESDNDSKSEEENNEVTYHVHKAILAYGPRRSDYFVRLFGNDGNFSEAQDSTSRIELTELAAQAFPELLDYMYTVGHEMLFTTKRGTALYSLAKYFGVRRLENEAKQFCLEDMKDPDKCGTYYEHAILLQAESILQAATKVCRDNIIHIDHRTSRLLSVPNPQFWIDLMEEHIVKGTISKYSSRLSKLIASFCSRHADVLSMDDFKQLADERHLLDKRNKVHVSAALLFLEAESLIVGNDEKQHEVEERAELTPLQARCVDIIARKKGKLDLLNQEPYRSLLRKLPKLVLCEILTQSCHAILHQ